ncbi:MAG: hypothetical protein HY856_13350 [Burkholderiales bacterium]|nr:hypothetical protein [Burkholderiales bacterium]
MDDVADPQVWWRRLVDAVIAYRLGMKEMVVDYLRWVESHRGRAVAEMARDNIKAYARAESWDNVHLWPAWGYQCKEPKTEAPEKKGRKRR